MKYLKKKSTDIIPFTRHSLVAVDILQVWWGVTNIRAPFYGTSAALERPSVRQIECICFTIASLGTHLVLSGFIRTPTRHSCASEIRPCSTILNFSNGKKPPKNLCGINESKVPHSVINDVKLLILCVCAGRASISLSQSPILKYIISLAFPQKLCRQMMKVHKCHKFIDILKISTLFTYHSTFFHWLYSWNFVYIYKKKHILFIST